jgi:hypothetical protein
LPLRPLTPLRFVRGSDSPYLSSYLPRLPN